MSAPTTYELFAVKYAHHDRPAADNFVFRDDVHDGPGPLDFFVWVARSAERTFVIDTGFSEATGRRRERQIIRNPKEGLAALGIDAGAGRGRDRHPPALRPRRQLRDLPARDLPFAGPRDGLRHRALHVPPAAADAVRRRERHRHGARGLSRPGRVPRRRRGDRLRPQPASGRRPQPRPAVRAGPHRARLGRGRLRCRPLLRQHGEAATRSRSCSTSARCWRATANAGGSRRARSTSCRATIRW